MSFFNFFKKKNQNESIKEVEGEKLFRQAVQYYQFGSHEEAIKLFTRSIEVSPNHSTVYVNRGSCYMIQERYLEAYDDFDYAIKMEIKGISLDEESCIPAAKQNMQKIQRFIAFEQKTGEIVRGQLAADGKEHFSKRWAEVLFDQALNNDTEKSQQFIYEEIKELEEMGGIHQEYALNCGVEYTKFSKVSELYNTEVAFLMFKSLLCCFSRDFKKMFEVRIAILDKLIKIVNDNSLFKETESFTSDSIKINFNGRMHLSKAEVDIMFVVKNGNVMYINNDAGDLYEIDNDGDMKLDGRVVNFVFKSPAETIEIFVAFDDLDSYSMFTANIGRDERLHHVAQAIFQFMGSHGIDNVFSLVERYSTQYYYTFKLYKKSTMHLLINNSQSQAYLISEGVYKSEDVDAIKAEFWSW